jgi:hypothetical protein
MEPARALQQEIGRCKLADHQVEVEVQTLLNDLGGYQHQSIRSMRIARSESSE